MLKIFAVIFSFFSIYSSCSLVVHDQSECIKTDTPKRSIRELYDETVTYFLSNPELATALVSLSEGTTQKNEGSEQVQDLSSVTKSPPPQPNDHEAHMIKLANNLNLINVIKDMYLIRYKKSSGRGIKNALETKAEINQVIINFN